MIGGCGKLKKWVLRENRRFPREARVKMKKVQKSAKKGLRFFEKFYILKSVDEHPHKQGKI